MLLHTISTLLASFWCSKALAQTIPVPQGLYGIAYSTTELTNTKMLDPFTVTKHYRRLMVSAFYPTTELQYCRQKSISYMPPGAASVYDQIYSQYGVPNGTMGTVRLTVCHTNTTGIKHNHPQYPIVVFSPGLGNSRLLYSAMAEAVAAQGFIVITVDHPYDSAVVEFPDGTLVTGVNISTKLQIESALTIRKIDVLFVLDQLHNHSVTQNLLDGLHGTLDLKKMFIYGHSLGGATAAATMQSDSRIRGGINLDGTFWGPVVQHGLDHPFMLFAHQGKNLSTDSSWASIWPHLNSSKVEVSVDRTAEGSYTDLPLLVDVLGLRDKLGVGIVEELIGSIGGQRLITIVGAYIKFFLTFAGGGPLPRELQMPVSEFPEVKVLESKLDS